MSSRRSESEVFTLLRRSRFRGRSGPIKVAFADLGREELVIGLAVGRKVGKAVVRNRIRRRIRAVCRDLGSQLPPGAYVFSSSSSASEMPYSELKLDIERAVSAATRPKEAR